MKWDQSGLAEASDCGAGAIIAEVERQIAEQGMVIVSATAPQAADFVVVIDRLMDVILDEVDRRLAAR